MPLRCVFFDLDGTLVDSEPLAHRALKELVPALDLSVEELVRLNRGVQLQAVFADVERRIGDRLPEDFEARYRARVADHFTRELKPVEGAIELLERLPTPAWVVSNAPRSKIGHALAVTGLERFFEDRIVSAIEAGACKPDPRPYRAALEAAGIDAAEGVAVEDSEPGAMSALGAGLRTVWVGPGEPRAGLAVTRLRGLKDLLALLQLS